MTGTMSVSVSFSGPKLHDLLIEANAEKMEKNPALLSIPLANIDRWLAQGHTAPHRLEKWRAILKRAQESPEGLKELLVLMGDQSEPAQRLKEFAPFAGVLTASERKVIIRQCAYSH